MSESLKDDVLEAARDAQASIDKQISAIKKEASEKEFGSPQLLQFSHDENKSDTDKKN